MKNISAVILAAGAGTRMKSDLPKVLHPICGKPMVSHVIKTVKSLNLDKQVVVVGNQEELVKNSLENEQKLIFVSQKVQSGTGDAVNKTRDQFVNYPGNILILYGDIPLLKKETLQNLIKTHVKSSASVTILTCKLDNPTGYGRIIRDAQNNVIKIVEEKDTNDLERQVKEINTGIYCFNAKKMFEALNHVKPNNKQKELYLTDVIEIFCKNNLKINTVSALTVEEVMGINNRVELSKANDYFRKFILENLMKNGVSIIHPESTFIDEEVKIEKDVIIYPFTIIEGKSIIKSGSKIGPYSFISNSTLSNNVEILNSTIRECILGKDVRVGPYANIRPGTVLKEKVKIGNFCEIKKSSIDYDSKVSHLSYIGDSEIGKNVNIGAGTITCNYDGKNKFKTIIGDDVFIGSNTNLIAPVEIAKRSLIAAGSTINKNVPKESLGIARAQQKTINGYYVKRRK